MLEKKILNPIYRISYPGVSKHNRNRTSFPRNFSKFLSLNASTAGKENNYKVNINLPGVMQGLELQNNFYIKATEHLAESGKNMFGLVGFGPKPFCSHNRRTC